MIMIIQCITPAMRQAKYQNDIHSRSARMYVME